MKKALFIPWSFTLLETYFPVADLLIQKGFEVSFINQLYDRRSSGGNSDKMVNRKKINYYKNYCGFTIDIGELKYLNDINWIDVNDIGDILNNKVSLAEGVSGKGRDISIEDYDLIVMRTEYNTWPIINKWMRKTKVAGMPIRMMYTEVNKKKQEIGYIFYDQCYKAKMKYFQEPDTVLYCYSGARNLYDPREADEKTAIINQKKFLREFIKIVVIENNKFLILRGHPQFHKYESNIYLNNIVNDICEELILDRSRVIIRNDTFIGKELAHAETAIFDPGASTIMKGIMFDCNILYIDFPWRYKPRTRSWYTKLFKKYLPDLFVGRFSDLDSILKSKSFPNIKNNSHLGYFSRYFDGRCTERSVDFIIKNIEETPFRLFVSSKVQSISNIILNRKDLRMCKI